MRHDGSSGARLLNGILVNWGWYVWSQPQTLLGYFLLLFLRSRARVSRITPFLLGTTIVELQDVRWGLSLGRFLFCGSRGRNRHDFEQLCLHELGHARQSLVLGPLYLLLIGVPSFLWATFKSRGCFPGRDYCWFYTESWAEAWKPTLDRLPD